MNKVHFNQARISWVYPVIIIVLITFLTGRKVNGQEEQPRLLIDIDRQVGFNLGDRIQGTFQISGNGPSELSRVEFLIDGQLLGEDDSAPFEVRLQTKDYTAGSHTLSAVGFLENGQTIESEPLRRDFVSGSLVTVALLTLIVLIAAIRLLPAIGRSRQSFGNGEGQGYGYLGGAVCRRCYRPFRLHVWSPRLLVGRLQRCPHCGKWQLARRASRASLVEAELLGKGSRGEASRTEKDSDEAKLSQLLEDSRFEDTQ